MSQVDEVRHEIIVDAVVDAFVCGEMNESRIKGCGKPLEGGEVVYILRAAGASPPIGYVPLAMLCNDCVRPHIEAKRESARAQAALAAGLDAALGMTEDQAGASLAIALERLAVGRPIDRADLFTIAADILGALPDGMPRARKYAAAKEIVESIAVSPRKLGRVEIKDLASVMARQVAKKPVPDGTAEGQRLFDSLARMTLEAGAEFQSLMDRITGEPGAVERADAARIEPKAR
jgi:hypothetical protein